MVRRLWFFLFLPGLLTGLVSGSFALEKVKLGSAVKMVPEYYLPVLTAEERGFWKENGLDVEWVPFASATAQVSAIAAGAIGIGIVGPDSPLAAAERGLPVVMVSELVPSYPFGLWVRADSPYRHVRDLKGARIGATALGATTHIMGRLIAAAQGMEKEVRFVGAGGVPQMVAGLRAGALEGVITRIGAIVDLKLAGQARELASASDYLPKPWTDTIIFSRKDFAQNKPDVVRKILRAALQASDYMRKNPRGTMDKMKSFQGLSEGAAKIIYDAIPFTITGKLDRKAVENVRRLLIEYGLLSEKVPAVDELFTNEYLS